MSISLAVAEPIPVFKLDEGSQLHELAEVCEVPRYNQVFLAPDGEQYGCLRKESMQPFGDQTLVLRFAEREILIGDHDFLVMTGGTDRGFEHVV